MAMFLAACEKLRWPVSIAYKLKDNHSLTIISILESRSQNWSDIWFKPYMYLAFFQLLNKLLCISFFSSDAFFDWLYFFFHLTHLNRSIYQHISECPQQIGNNLKYVSYEETYFNRHLPLPMPFYVSNLQDDFACHSQTQCFCNVPLFHNKAA